MKITIIGDGGWGTALSLLLSSYGHNVTVWGPFEEYTKEVATKGENYKFLPGVLLPKSIIWTSNTHDAVRDTDCFVIASPSKFYESVLKKFGGLIPENALVVSVTKGFSEDGKERMSEIAKRILSIRDVVVLSGPSHAEEVARAIPTAVVASSTNLENAQKVQSIFMGPRFRVYTSQDPIGAEIGGAVKNVIAVAVGVSDGMNFGDNTRAALISRGLIEMTRLGIAMGAKSETFSGLTGVGDLVVTCSSKHSRNHSVGERLGKGEKIKDILASMQMVAEGVWNSHIVCAIAKKYNIAMPITEIVHRLCEDKIKPEEALEILMSRDACPEM